MLTQIDLLYCLKITVCDKNGKNWYTKINLTLKGNGNTSG